MPQQEGRLVITRKFEETITVEGPASSGVVTFPREEAVDSLPSNPKSQIPNPKSHHQRWLVTLSGTQFDPWCPTTEMVVIKDIAHGLAGEFRFGNQSERRYSVAQHSVSVSRRFADPTIAMWGLLHDAAEAYIGDWQRPIKVGAALRDPSGLMVTLEKVEQGILAAVAAHVGLAWHGVPSQVNDADVRELARERRELFPPDHPRFPSLKVVAAYPEPIICWPPEQAEDEFLDRFDALKQLLREAAA